MAAGGRRGAFVGRASDLDRLDDLLSTTRLVTVTGVGGVGKTRLASELLTIGSDWWTDPVVIDLVVADRDTDLLSIVAARIGIAESPDSTMLEQVVGALDRPGSILVLDACEVAMDAVRRVVTTLLNETNHLRILTTSRAPLVVEDEQLLRLFGLPTVEAMELFHRVACSVAPEVPLDERDTVTIEALCARLDGLPLALELAAARLVVLRPGQLLDRLDDRLTLLVEPSRDPRQRAMADVIEVTIDALPDLERQALKKLSVLIGWFSLSEAEAATGTAIVSCLERLRSHGLLATRTAARQMHYRLLDTIRAAAQARLTDEETAATRARLVRWAAEHTRHHTTDPELDAVHDQLIAALDWAEDLGDAESAVQIALSLAPYWLRRGILTEGRSQLRRVEPLADGVERALVERVAARLALAQSDTSDARRLLDDAGRLLDRCGDTAGRRQLLIDYADLFVHEGDTDQAIAALETSAAGQLGADDPTFIAAAIRRADLHRLAGQSEIALQLAGDALAAAVDGGHRRAEAEARMTVGAAHEQCAEIEAARASFELSLEAFRALDDHAGIGAALSALGRLATNENRFDEALHLQGKAIDELRRAGDERATAAGLSDLAWSLFLVGQFEESLRLSQDSLRLAQRLGHCRLIAIGLFRTANAAFVLGRPLGPVRNDVDRSIAMFRQLGDARNVAHATYLAGEVALEQADHAAAAEYVALACDLFATFDPENVALPLVTRSAVAVEQGRRHEAALHLSEAVDAAAAAANRSSLKRATASTAALVADADLVSAVRLMGWSARIGTAGFAQRRLRAMAARVESDGKRLLADFDAAWMSPVPTVDALIDAVHDALRRVTHAPDALPSITITLLGDFAVTVGDVQHRLGGVTAPQVLKLVALRGSIHIDELIETLWPDADVASARSRLRSVLARLKRNVGDIVHRDGELFVLDPDVDVDVCSFDRAVDHVLETTRRRDPAAVAHARDAVARYGGDLLPGDPYSDAFFDERQRLRRRYRTALEVLVDAALEDDAVADAVDLLSRIAAVDPYDESLYVRMATLLEGRGWRSRAVAVLRRGFKAAAELGVEPSLELQAAWNDINGRRRPSTPPP